MMFFMMGLAIGSSTGLYNMLPLYLVTERGFEREWANTITSLSRISGVLMIFIAGWIVDRFELKKSLALFLLALALLTTLIGIVPRGWVIPIIFIQAPAVAAFFLVALAAISRLGSPLLRNIYFSIIIPINFLIGSGLIPVGLGYLGEHYSFSSGIVLLGVMMLVAVFLTRHLKISNG
jgi:MFS transporter, NNP family, nitrate/nitrite transporter